MDILVVGGGGREHAIVWKLRQSKNVEKIYCAPGNAGISELAECVPIGATDISALVDFAKQKNIDFTVVGMDDPLVLGIVDVFTENNLKIFGPRKNAAIIEGSKAFSKDLMKKYNLPTASYETFCDYESASDYLKTQKFPLVIKADGLALGKGVIICNVYEEAEVAIKEMFVDKKFGQAGSTVVIEEFLIGKEVSVLAFCDGKTIVPMVSAQDHKRAFDHDLGLNTGGMGTFSPSKLYTEDFSNHCMEKIFKPTVSAMLSENREFKGILYFGLIFTDDGVKILEYNARFGDPETQVVLPRLKTDFLEILLACVDGNLNQMTIEWEDNAAVCVIMASGGYPESYKKGYEIKGLEEVKNFENVYVFHSGTSLVDEKIVTNGGRVLGVTGFGKNMDVAIKTAYHAVDHIDFQDKHFRKDIGVK